MNQATDNIVVLTQAASLAPVVRERLLHRVS